MSQGRNKPSQTDEPIQVFCSGDGMRRVNIFRRESGTFYFQEERLSQQEIGQSWVPARQSVASFFDTQETAVEEARWRIDWLRDMLFWAEAEML